MPVSSVDYVIATILYIGKFMCGSAHTSLKYLTNESFPSDISLLQQQPLQEAGDMKPILKHHNHLNN